MNEISRSALRPLSDSSPSTVVAGFIAMLTGYTSSLVLMFQAGQAAGLSAGQISSWIWALSIGMAICSIGLSLRYRTPVVVAWSTPGAALLITSLPGVPYAEAIGAFIFASALIALCGITGSFDRLMRRGYRRPWPPRCWQACCSTSAAKSSVPLVSSRCWCSACSSATC